MKNIIKTIGLLTVAMLFMVSCNDDDTGEPNFVNEARGWIQFPDANADIILVTTPDLFELGVNIQVPVTDSDLEIGYRLVPVSGPDPNSFFSNTGSFTVPAGVTSWSGADTDNNTNDEQILPPIIFDITEAPFGIPVTFDVILTSTSSSDISVGLGNDFPIVQRLSIPCFNPEVAPSDYFVGDYAIADVAATIGPANNTVNFAAGTVTLTVDPSNPNARLFQARIIPLINAAPQTISITFNSVDNAVSLGFVDPNISCDMGATLYFYGPETIENSSPWDVCNDSSITITYVEDSAETPSCGGPFASSFSLTKI